MVVPATCLSNKIVGALIVVHCTIGVKVNCTMSRDYCVKKLNWHLEIICVMPEIGAVAQDMMAPAAPDGNLGAKPDKFQPLPVLTLFADATLRCIKMGSK